MTIQVRYYSYTKTVMLQRQQQDAHTIHWLCNLPEPNFSNEAPFSPQQDLSSYSCLLIYNTCMLTEMVVFRVVIFLSGFSVTD